MIPNEIKKILVRQHYRIVGKHSAVKLCHWLKKSILDENFCYKQKFYGISSHRCLQFTPAVVWCSQRCLYCWRNTEQTLGYKMNMKDCDEPEFIVEEAIKAQRILLTGYGGIPERINKRKFKEAQNPNQVAISLSGEPTIYPKISELIEEFSNRNFTTFLVTNGTFPEVLEELRLPTQLYVSLTAPNREIYKKICNPIIPDGWERINETLNLFPSLSETRRVIRITLVKGWNDKKVENYANLIEKSETDFVEIKSYMFLGGSRRRLNLENMPSFEYVKDFAEKINENLSYKLKDSKEDSRVVLLSKK